MPIRICPEPFDWCRTGPIERHAPASTSSALRIGHGQDHLEAAPAVRLSGHDCPTMGNHDLSTDRQAQPTSAAVGGAAGVEPGEPLEHAVAIRGTDDLAVIV